MSKKPNYVFVDPKKSGSKDSMMYGLDIMNINVTRNSKMISAPVESGRDVFDNKVLTPKEVKVSAIIANEDDDPSEVWSTLLKMYENRTYDTYAVCTKNEVVENLVLTNLEKNETTEKYDAVEVILSFKELMISSMEVDKYPKSRDDAGTKVSGSKAMSDAAYSQRMLGGGLR